MGEDTVSCRHRLFIPAKQAPIGIYNLNGVRQAKPQKGINIIDWNKVLVKWEMNQVCLNPFEREAVRLKFRVQINWERSTLPLLPANRVLRNPLSMPFARRGEYLLSQMTSKKANGQFLSNWDTVVIEGGQRTAMIVYSLTCSNHKKRRSSESHQTRLDGWVVREWDRRSKKKFCFFFLVPLICTIFVDG